MTAIVQVSNVDDLEIIKTLFIEYRRELGVDFCFQSFEQESSALPGDYSSPDGCLLVLKKGVEAIGCVAFKPINNSICEMKRLYIRREFRRQHFGKQLAVRVIDAARGAGYLTMKLETFSSLVAATSLYQELGFVASELINREDKLDLVEMTLDLR